MFDSWFSTRISITNWKIDKPTKLVFNDLTWFWLGDIPLHSILHSFFSRIFFVGFFDMLSLRFYCTSFARSLVRLSVIFFSSIYNFEAEHCTFHIHTPSFIGNYSVSSKYINYLRNSPTTRTKTKTMSKRAVSGQACTRTNAKYTQAHTHTNKLSSAMTKWKMCHRSHFCSHTHRKFHLSSVPVHILQSHHNDTENREKNAF